jgi:hypothetical protein
LRNAPVKFIGDEHIGDGWLGQDSHFPVITKAFLELGLAAELISKNPQGIRPPKGNVRSGSRKYSRGGERTE